MRPKKNNAKDATDIEKAIKLRMQGLSYEQISQRMGFKNKSTAFRLIKRALDSRIDESVDTMRKVQQLVLDDLFRAVWPMAFPKDIDGEKQPVNLWAVDRLLKIINAECKLWGLYTHDCPRCRGVGRNKPIVQIKEVAMSKITIETKTVTREG